MKKYLVFFMLVTVLLLEQSLGETESIAKTNDLTPNGKAFRDAVKAKLATLSEEPVKLAKQLLVDAYAAKLNIENATTVLAEVFSDFEKLKPDTIENKITAFLGLSFLFEIVSGRVSINDDEESKGDLLTLNEVLEAQEYKGVALQFHQTFDEFLEWLTQEFEAKSNNLTANEQLRIKAFKGLCLQYKEETNFGKKKDFMEAIDSRVK